MRRIVGFVVLALALLSPGAALAKDVCVVDESGAYWIFKSVKKLKPLRVVPLHGVYLRLGAPVTGTAYMDGTGDVRIGVVGHTMGPFDPFGGNSVLVNILGDASFAGQGYYDSNGDFVPDTEATWTSVECSVALNPT
jgi:hypothetical protein